MTLPADQLFKRKYYTIKCIMSLLFTVFSFPTINCFCNLGVK